ncbi:hypothetical protein ACE6H2_001217 [Prunus campanulata]
MLEAMSTGGGIYRLRVKSLMCKVTPMDIKFSGCFPCEYFSQRKPPLQVDFKNSNLLQLAGIFS